VHPARHNPIIICSAPLDVLRPNVDNLPADVTSMSLASLALRV
jgi:hypothetical protein